MPIGNFERRTLLETIENIHLYRFLCTQIDTVLHTDSTLSKWIDLWKIVKEKDQKVLFKRSYWFLLQAFWVYSRYIS